MAVKIRLKRFGKKKAPFYRVVVMDARTKRDGRAIEEIGIYHPTREPSVIEINSERALYWLGQGAQPTEQVFKLLTLTGDWGKFKGDKDAKNTVKPQIVKASPEDKIKDAAKGAEREKAAKAKAAEDAAKKATADKAAAEKAAADAAKEAAKEVDPIADESSEVPSDEGTEVEVEIAEGDPSDADDKVEGIIDEEK